MEFSYSGLADIINGLISSILTAILVFVYIWYSRKKPNLNIEVICYNQEFTPTINNNIYSAGKMGVKVLISNRSIYDARCMQIVISGSAIGNGHKISKNLFTLKSEEEITKIFFVELENTLLLESSLFRQELRNKAEQKISMVLTYVNDDNKDFTKKVILTPVFQSIHPTHVHP